MNTTEGHDDGHNIEAREVFLWSYIAIATLCCIIGVLGNGLVIYLSYYEAKRTAFVYLNKAVKNLAVTDFLYCVLAIPLTAVWYHWGKLFYLCSISACTKSE